MTATIAPLNESTGYLSESRKGGAWVFPNSVLSEFEIENENGRTYSESLWENVLKDPHVSRQVTTRCLLGELDHPFPNTPESDVVSLKNASHLITEMRIDNGKLVGTVEILDTAAGKVAKALHEAKVPLQVSSRAKGSTTVRGGRVYVDEATYMFKTFDLVADPSFIRARLNESQGDDGLDKRIKQIVDENPDEADKISQIYENVQKQALTKTSGDCTKVEKGVEKSPIEEASSIFNRELSKKLSNGDLTYGDVLALRIVCSPDMFFQLAESYGLDPHDFGLEDFENIDERTNVLRLERQVSDLTRELMDISEDLNVAQDTLDHFGAQEDLVEAIKDQTEIINERVKAMTEIKNVVDSVEEKLQENTESPESSQESANTEPEPEKPAPESEKPDQEDKPADFSAEPAPEVETPENDSPESDDALDVTQQVEDEMLADDEPEPVPESVVGKPKDDQLKIEEKSYEPSDEVPSVDEATPFQPRAVRFVQSI